jgi:hypothetical protein
VIDHYDEDHNPGRRKDDARARASHIGRQVNITIEAGGIGNGGQLVVCMDGHASPGHTTGSRIITLGEATNE